MRQNSRIPLLALLAFTAAMIWSQRPPERLTGRPPTFLTPGTDTSQAAAMADSIFMWFGAPLDTVELSPGSLRLVLQGGAFIRQTRLAGTHCIHSLQPRPAVRNVAAAAYS